MESNPDRFKKEPYKDDEITLRAELVSARFEGVIENAPSWCLIKAVEKATVELKKRGITLGN